MNFKRTKTSSADVLVTELATVVAECDQFKAELRHTQSQLRAMVTRVNQLQTQSRAITTLHLSAFTNLGVGDIYTLICESLVYQLGWDTAYILTVQGTRGIVRASYGATERQLNHLKDSLPRDTYFLQLYTSMQALSTFHSEAHTDLALRSLFCTDDLMALPIQFGDHLYGYLIVCAHTQKALKRTQEDLDFLSTLASQVAHAVQFSNSFKDLEDQNTQLRHLDELKDSFITITSHQLRTPLSIVKWILSILQSDKELAHMPEQNHLINQAYSSNERLIHVVNELLNVSRVQDGKLPCSPQLIDVVPLLRDLANSATKMGADHHISVTAEIEPGLPLLCLDPLLTKQLFQDLMDNALDYNQDNGWIHLSAKREAGKLVIVFVNSGMGIGEEDSRKVFDQFFRGPEAMRQQPNGNGLGLYLARAIVDSHQGKIDFKSSPGESTTFTISLPIPE